MSSSSTAPVVAAAARVTPATEPTLMGALGWMPLISLVSAAGLLCLAATDRLSASGINNLEPLYWISLLVIAGPIGARLLALRARRAERLGLVLVFGLDLYLVKVLQSPFAFTYADEFVHLFNANRIIQSGHLFSPNSILPASALYPGLESATAGLVHLTGLSAFEGGLLIIGLARVIMVLALFLLYEQMTHSARVASLACVLYAANANFVYWSVQYSYESLALPLACLAVYVVARRESGRWPRERRALSLMALVLITTVVITHHLSSYFLVVALLLWTALARIQRRLGDQLLEQPWVATPLNWFRRAATQLAGRPAASQPRAEPEAGGPAGLALFALLAVLFWLFFVANLTLSYLSPVFVEALRSVVQWIGGEATARTLFQSTSGVVTPLLDRTIGILAAVLCLLGLPFGLRQVWRRSAHNPAMLLSAVAAVTYFGSLGLRFLPSAWEIANRSSEFLFVGLAPVLALGHYPGWGALRRGVQPALVAALMVVLAGGVIAGWPPSLRLAQTYQAVADQKIFEPAGLTVARATVSQLGPGHRIAADEANGRYLLVYANEDVLIGRYPDVQDVLEQPGLSADEVNFLRATGIEFILVDRRIVSSDPMAGFFFDHSDQWPLPSSQLWPPAAYNKFDQLPGANRIIDSGNAVLFDLRAVTGAAAKP
jgi:hypothetical protein